MNSEFNTIVRALSTAGGGSPVRSDLVFGEWNSRLLFGAWCGTSLAGGVFGVLLFFWELVFPINFTFYSSVPAIVIGFCQFFLGCCLGFVVGALWAAVVGLYVYFGAIVLILAIGTKRMPYWAVGFFGGMTAFSCCGGFVWVAVTLGQLGAEVVARMMLSGMQGELIPEASDSRNQFALSQLFRFMTVACLCLGIVSLLPVDDQFRSQMGYCLAWQCVVALLIGAAEKLRARRST